ncbi:MAG: site-specific integrase [Candidatus Eisenbacteria bacterium]
MIERFFVRPRVIRRFHDSPVGEYIDRCAELLWEQGYARGTARGRLLVVEDLGWWLHRQGLGVEALDEDIAERFLHEAKRLGFGHPAYFKAALQDLLSLLREAGKIPPARAPQIEDTPIERINRDFKQYLTQERQLADSTLENMIPFVKRFLTERFGTGPVILGELTRSDVTRFLLRHVQILSPGRAQLMTYALRTFFRFLRFRGDTEIDLSVSVPKVANWRLSTLPKSLQADEVERLIDSCDQTTIAGQRDYTILLLLARLGLRAGEVVAMTLDDIDWEAGELTVRGKGGRDDRLPIPEDVGSALAHYLRHGRPKCTTRRVFVRMHAPRRGFTTSVAICDVVRRALSRASIDSPRKGAHLLRHSLACEMLRKGVSLDGIGEVLRHQRADTTAIYAKVDIVALQDLARPWPGGEA